MISEKEFGLMYHVDKVKKFDRLYIFLKTTYKIMPILFFFITSFKDINVFLYFFILTILSITVWLFSIKMKSLRDINLYAARLFNEMCLKETFK